MAIRALFVVMRKTRNEILTSIVQCEGEGVAEQGWHSDESTPLPPQQCGPGMFPTRYHM